MASTIAISPLNPGGGGSAKDFHCFPDLPAELRVRIWQMAYHALPQTLVYRFRLKFSYMQDSEEAPKPKAFLEPLEEVGFLTSELRSLRRVNTECRLEGDRYFGDDILRFNQTEAVDATDICSPINLPWSASSNMFCFVGLTEPDVACLKVADTSLIDQVFSTVQLVGLGLDTTGEGDIDHYYDLSDFILLFPKVRHASLVSDQLMSEADLDNISEDIRSEYILSSWYDWFGRVPEEVFDSHCEDPKVITKDQHLGAAAVFSDAMYTRGDDDHEYAGALLGVLYGMVFRTKECLDYLLWDPDLLDQVIDKYGLFDDLVSDDDFGGSSEENEDI